MKLAQLYIPAAADFIGLLPAPLLLLLDKELGG
jgi:hypothetical protein